MRKRTRIRHEIKEELLQSSDGRCSVCGAKSVALEIAHILPIIYGGDSSLENLMLVCPKCHMTLDRSGSELEFVHYLYELLEKHLSFSNSEIDVFVRHNVRADIITHRDDTSLLIECKNAFVLLSGDGVKSTIMQIDRYRKFMAAERYVVAFPGRASPAVLKMLDDHSIEVWDIDYISNVFHEQIQNSSHPYFKRVFLGFAPNDANSVESRLISNLRSCGSGKQHWIDYQTLVGQILEQLFCPPLLPPLLESPDKLNVNRRDFIFPNYSDAGFWHFLRQSYKADYIVVDAKNYKNPISKNQVLQIANYLKPHGAGLFAIIATRAGVDRSADLVMREQWIVANKMILAVNDADLEAMLLAASSGGEAYKVLGQAIQDFRLSM